MRPRRLGRYELLRHLATGGMSRVYLARTTGPGGFARHVVVKTVPRERCDDEAFVAMFLDEARLIATLHHQHIAQVFEVGRGDDGTYFLVMEYVHGETVRNLLETAGKKSVRLPLELGLSITCAAAAGLHHAHERRDIDGRPLGIVHRDVSPSNLILGYDGSIKLIDFGIAKASGRATETASGFVKGKAGYMAPEQARGYIVDRRSDVFALGVLAYELTTQTRALYAETQFEIMRRTAHADIEPPSRRVPGYPPALEDVIMTALEVDPDDRFQDAESMRVALEQVARELELPLGATPVTRALEQLFPPRPEPWLDRSAPLEHAETTPAPSSDSEPQIMIVQRTPTRQRLARGTETPRSYERALLTPTEPVEHTTEPFARDVPRLSDLAIAAFIRAPEQALAHPGHATRSAVQLRSNKLPLPAPTTTISARGPVTPVPAPAPVLPLPAPEPSVPIATTPVAELGTSSTSAADHAPADVPAPDATPDALPASLEGARGQLVASQRPPTIGSRIQTVIGNSRRTIVLGSAALVVVAVGIALLIGTSTSPLPGTKIASAPHPAPSPPPVEVPSPRPPPTPAKPAAHGTIELSVTTDPPGATVVLDGARLGKTPLTMRVPTKSDHAWLKVRKRRYKSVKTRVALDRDVTWDVTLRPRSKH